MKNAIRTLGFAAIAAMLTALAFTACDNGDSGTTPSGGKTVTAIIVTTQPTKISYNTGEALNTSGMVVTATYSDGTTAAVTGIPPAALTLQRRDKKQLPSVTGVKQQLLPFSLSIRIFKPLEPPPQSRRREHTQRRRALPLPQQPQGQQSDTPLTAQPQPQQAYNIQAQSASA